MTTASGVEAPVLNTAAFERTASYLAPDAVAKYLRTIAEHSENLLRALAEPDAFRVSVGGLADAAHTLAGSAGLFGFERLVELSRGFERAARHGGSDAPVLAGGLGLALGETIRTIQGMGSAGGGPASPP